jgi:hypothetical protein
MMGVMFFEIVYRQGGALHTETVRASDLPAAVHGFYASRGPASGGSLMPTDMVSVSEVTEASE